MDDLEQYQRDVAKLAARAVGLQVTARTRTAAADGAIRHESAIHALPSRAGWTPLQDLDPTSATYGAFFFVVDFSDPNGPDIIG